MRTGYLRVPQMNMSGVRHCQVRYIQAAMEPFDEKKVEPWNTFNRWMEEAKQAEPNDPNAAALATAAEDGTPSVRMVLVKGISERGLRFFTHEDSQKGRELLVNPRAALVLHWKSLRRQVRFQGEVSVLGHEETDEYFHSRSRRSQIAAAISQQSRPLASREEMEREVQAYSAKLDGAPVLLPRHWRGFLLNPGVIEFWADGPDRLHDRNQFLREGEGWRTQRLYP